MPKKKPVNILHEKVRAMLAQEGHKLHEIQYGAKAEGHIAYQVNFIQYLVTPAGIGNGESIINLKDGNYDECVSWLKAKIDWKYLLSVGDNVRVIDRKSANYKEQGTITQINEGLVLVNGNAYFNNQLFKLN